MKNSVYSKVRRRVVVEFIVLTALISLAAAAVGFSTLLFIAKLIPAELPLPAYIGISVGCFVVAAALMAIFRLPTSKKICQRADKEFALKEQMLTANEFKDNEDDAMIKIQREEAYKNLNEHKKSRMSFSFSLLPFILCLFAGGTVAVSTAVPYRQVEVQAVEEEQSSKESVDNSHLIDVVESIMEEISENTKVDQETKDDINSVLDDLREDLEEGEQDPEDAIQDAIDELDKKEQDATSYDEVGEAMEDKDVLGELGEAIKEGDEEKIDQALDDLLEDLDDMTDEEFQEAVDEIIKELEETLEELEEEGVDATGVQDALEDLLEELEEAQKNDDVQTERQDVDKALSEGVGSVKEAIEQEKANKEAIEEAMKDLEEMLKDMENNQQTPQNSGSGAPNSRPDNPQGTPSGNMPPQSGGQDGQAQPGTGSGALIFADDELIYDPETNSYVTYGDLLNYYYALLNGEISEADIPEDVLKILYEYFAYLFYEDEENNSGQGGQTTPPTEGETSGGNNNQGE